MQSIWRQPDLHQLGYAVMDKLVPGWRELIPILVPGNATASSLPSQSTAASTVSDATHPGMIAHAGGTDVESKSRPGPDTDSATGK